MYQIAICDDDQSMLKAITGIVDQSMNEEHCLLSFSSPEDLLAYMNDQENTPIQILIMDILLDKENGIDVSEKIKRLFPNTKIIFLTGYPEYSQWSYDVEHIWFLLKPVENKLLEKALQRAVRAIEDDQKAFFTIEKKGEPVLVPYKNILFISSNLRKLSIHLTDGSSYEYYGRLDVEEKQFPDTFIRCHKSFLVNISRVQQMKGRGIILKDEQGKQYEVPVSNSCMTATKEAILTYSTGKIGSSLIR